MPYKVSEVLASWQGKFGSRRNISLWRFVPHCLLWCLWWERNVRCFEDCERSILDINGCLVGLFKQLFLVFKHHNTYFHNT